MESPVYNIQGKKTGTVNLPERVFNVAWNDALMHQVIVSMQANTRTPVAHTKFRGEVRGGGKKPWQQKGTGRARHGSIRSPIWRGGGVTHGPRSEKVHARAIPKKMRAKALFMALSRKLKDNEALFVDSFGLSAPKTASAKKALVALATVKGFERISSRKNAVLIAIPERSEALLKSFRNIGSVEVDVVSNLSPVDVLKYKYLVVENPSVSIPVIEKRGSKNKSTSKPEARS